MAARRTESNVARLNRLRLEINTSLELSAEQRKTIERLFDEHLRAIREDQHSEAGSQMTEEDLKELQAIQARMVTARQAGDTEAVEKTREELIAKARSLRRPGRPGNAQFYRQISEQLNDKQREAFEALVRRHRTERLPRPQNGPLRELLKALRDPEVGLTAEQRDKLRDLLKDAITANAPGEIPEEERRARIAKKLHEDVRKILTPEQAAKLDEVLRNEERRQAGSGSTGTGKRPATSAGEGKSPHTDDFHGGSGDR
jgi:Spy/CpxP family protein refolding chaperone